MTRSEWKALHREARVQSASPQRGQWNGSMKWAALIQDQQFVVKGPHEHSTYAGTLTAYDEEEFLFKFVPRDVRPLTAFLPRGVTIQEAAPTPNYAQDPDYAPTGYKEDAAYVETLMKEIGFDDLDALHNIGVTRDGRTVCFDWGAADGKLLRRLERRREIRERVARLANHHAIARIRAETRALA